MHFSLSALGSDLLFVRWCPLVLYNRTVAERRSRPSASSVAPSSSCASWCLATRCRMSSSSQRRCVSPVASVDYSLPGIYTLLIVYQAFHRFRHHVALAAAGERYVSTTLYVSVLLVTHSFKPCSASVTPRHKPHAAYLVLLPGTWFYILVTSWYIPVRTATDHYACPFRYLY